MFDLPMQDDICQGRVSLSVQRRHATAAPERPLRYKGVLWRGGGQVETYRSANPYAQSASMIRISLIHFRQ